MPTTTQIHVEPSAMVIHLPDEHVVLCHEVLGQARMRVDAVDDVARACERIPRLMPQIVVAGANLDDDALQKIEDRAVAVGAVFILLLEQPDYVMIERQLEGAVAIARERFGRRKSP